MIQRRAFERLLRNVLSFPSRPAVIVFMTMLARRFPDTQENDLLVIAQHYRVPVVSTRCASLRTAHCSGSLGDRAALPRPCCAPPGVLSHFLHSARALGVIAQHYRVPVVSTRCASLHTARALRVIGQHCRVPAVSPPGVLPTLLHTAPALLVIAQHYRAPIVSTRCACHVPAHCSCFVTCGMHLVSKSTSLHTARFCTAAADRPKVAIDGSRIAGGRLCSQ